MKRVLIVLAVLAFLCVLVLVALPLGDRLFKQDREPAAETPSTNPPSTLPATSGNPQPAGSQPGFLYARITGVGGATYEGRLRWGGGEEAFWGDYFNGEKGKNPWLAYLPPERQTERRPFRIFGIELGQRDHAVEVERLFMARFGDIARIEAHGREVQVTLKSGTLFDVNRMDASDFDDGVRVWDRAEGAVELDSLEVRSIELLPTAALDDAPMRLYGTVRTPHAAFTGFVQWDREECVGTDELSGNGPEGPRKLRFDTIQSIARQSHDSSVVTLLDGSEVTLRGTNDVGDGNRGIYVEDARYGRVLVHWDSFERVDFSPGGSGPGYGDFPPGRPLTGSVTTRAGGHFAGRIVYDLDESETTETLDAPVQGVDYTIPFGMVASISVPPAAVTLHNGETLQLEHRGDLGEKNAGMLIFVDGNPTPRYVPWAEVEKIEFDRPASMYPPLGGS